MAAHGNAFAGTLGAWPSADAFQKAAMNPLQLYAQYMEQWQKGWADVVTGLWAKRSSAARLSCCLRQHGQHRLHCGPPAGSKPDRSRTITARSTDDTDGTDGLSRILLTLIVLVPARPSRENVTSMPRVRRKVCARRSRPASARGFFAHPDRSRYPREHPSHTHAKGLTRSRPTFRSAMSVRTQVATGSASMMLSMAALRFAA